MSYIQTSLNKSEPLIQSQPAMISKSSLESDKTIDFHSKLYIPSPTQSPPAKIITLSPSSSPLSISPSSHSESPHTPPSSPTPGNLSIPYLSLSTHPGSSHYQTPTPHTSASKTNYICSCLLACGIRTDKDLNDKFPLLLKRIDRNPAIFKTTSTQENCKILQDALNAYDAVDGLQLKLTQEHVFAIDQFLNSPRHHKTLQQNDDVMRVAQAYEDLEVSRSKLQNTSNSLLSLLESQDYVSCPNVIFGCGDTGTTIWLEKYKGHHHQTQSFLQAEQVPHTLMIGENFGSWGHDYTLAQPHSLLERCGTKFNPSNYVSDKYYQSNPYTNSRHVLQANISNLADTDAPVLLDIHVDHIEKRSNHREDWKEKNYKYRLMLTTPHGNKILYTNKIDISTGLGPPRNAIGGMRNKSGEEIISQHEFERLSKFNADKNFTPIVDGNQFVLTPVDQLTKNPRSIVIYGGGGTGAACFRIAYHDQDTRIDGSTFAASRKVNDPKWISARGFKAAGSGKLVQQVFEYFNKRHEPLPVMELMRIQQDPRTGKLKLLFQPLENTIPVEIECDQLVHSTGQDNTELMQLTREINSDLNLAKDKTGMPVCVTNSDSSINFFGAGAMAMRTKEYDELTWKWLDSEQIGRDVGPGSMPPTRAQIRGYLASRGKKMENVNVNMDNHEDIAKFLERKGVPSKKISAMMEDILIHRKDSTCGMSKAQLQALLTKHKIDGLLKIEGLSYLVPKK